MYGGEAGDEAKQVQVKPVMKHGGGIWSAGGGGDEQRG